ncbi:MAG: XRE family transcriptional regulator [Candidatus Abyssobacteria bacterium SURF_5]|uniref:XRE family transcriptional regulator n=1 Tax=Abyssobacteria bacterium (strain SURF_5) TaxID=2093360 RepID=A0A3A4N1J8_ABYX5|nr:MAG: XRE family transcriptional regulator [Candidatus Abyssubacteria bacterium SURF_5]
MQKSPFTNKYNKFRKLLIEARKKSGLTQKEVAEKLSRPQSFVSKYERGERRLDVVEFLEIAKALEISLFSFFRKLEEDTRQQ